MKDLKAIIFDLDGVIVDTARYHFIAWRKLANDLGFDFDEHDNEKLKGVSRVESLNLILKMGNVSKTEEEKTMLAAHKNDHYQSLIAGMNVSEILPGALELLKEIKNTDIYCVLGSASKNARRILEYVGLFDYFDEIVDGTNVSKAKPDPEVFTVGADALGIDYDSVVVIEDSLAGIQAANTAGMFSIGIGDEMILNAADWVIPSLENIHLSDIQSRFFNKNLEDN